MLIKAAFKNCPEFREWVQSGRAHFDPDLGSDMLAHGFSPSAVLTLLPVYVTSVGDWITNEGRLIKGKGLVNFRFQADEGTVFCGSVIVPATTDGARRALAAKAAKALDQGTPLVVRGYLRPDLAVDAVHERFVPLSGKVMCFDEAMADIPRPHTRGTQDSLEQMAKALIGTAKERAKSKGLPFDIPVPWLVERLRAGRCEATGVALDLSGGAFKDERQNPLRPSLDQIEPGQGYTQNNVRVVTWFFNRAKADWSHETTMDMLSLIHNAA